GHGSISKKPDPSDGFWSSTGVSELYLVSILHVGEVCSGWTDATIFILCVNEVVFDFWIGHIQSDKNVGSNLLPSTYEGLIYPIGTEGDVDELVLPIRPSNISCNDTSCGCIYELNFPSLKTALWAFLIALHSSDVTILWNVFVREVHVSDTLVHKGQVVSTACRIDRNPAGLHRLADVIHTLDQVADFPIPCSIRGVRTSLYPVSVFHRNEPAGLRAVVLVQLIPAQTQAPPVREVHVPDTLVHQRRVLVTVRRIDRNPAGLHRLANVIHNIGRAPVCPTVTCIPRMRSAA